MALNMVLRYRDLVAKTIDEHRHFIKKYGYVWWGWWNKPKENIPQSELDQINEIIKKNDYMWIFLVDSGTSRLQLAKLTEISISPDGMPTECPEFDRVPEYYFTSKYKLWFRFNEIEETTPDEISKWSYAFSKDFLHPQYDRVPGNNRIESIQEMIDYHMTIYFIEEYEKNAIKNEESDKLKLNRLADNIMKLVEKINQQCDLYKGKESPLKIPKYPKKIEHNLNLPIENRGMLVNFIDALYKLIYEGHYTVLMEDRSIISKNDFYKIKQSKIIEDVRLLRNDFHHSDTKRTMKKRDIGNLYYRITNNRLLDDRESKIKLQYIFLQETTKLLEQELSIVKKRLKGRA